MSLGDPTSGSVIRRFVVRGLRDAEVRLRRITRPDPAMEAEVVGVVEQSAVVRGLNAALLWVRASGGSSIVVATVSRLWEQTAGAPHMRRLAGVVLLTAAVVHVLMMAAVGGAPGWLWLIVPGLAAAAGLLLLA